MGWAKDFNIHGKPLPAPPDEYSSRLRTYSPPTAQIHVSFRGMKGIPVTEAYLRELFLNFGEVIDVVIKKLQVHPVSLGKPP